jgi:ribonuclease BN (tRNA processing enzyme)
MHSDHTIGYPDLIYTPWVMGRDEPVQVYGPKGLDDMTAHMLKAYDMDKQQRICGLEAINPDGFGAESHEIEAGYIYEDDLIKVDAFAVDHGDTWDAYGFRFETPDGVIVISGDTRPSPALVDASKNCDILLHEVYSAAGFKKRPKDWQRYHSHMHTSTEELAEIASEIKPGLLVMTHLLLWGKSENELVKEVEDRYDGNVICADDLDIFELDEEGCSYGNLLQADLFED